MVNRPTLSDSTRSAALLTGANVVCGAIGVLQGLLVLRMLGPEGFGAAAVVVALTAVATNLVDVRLTDLISKLYYDPQGTSPGTGAAYRAAALRLGVRGYAASAILIVAASALVLALGAHRLTDVELTARLIWLAAIAQGLSYFGSYFTFIQRFTIPARQMALLQLGSTLINAGAMVAAVGASRSVGGYVAGLLASAVGITGLNAAFMLAALRASGVGLLGDSSIAASRLDRGVILRFVAAGNMLGYVRLLHRAADVLLVAAFCGDRETGIYKLARSIADASLVVSEAIGRIYQPRLLALLQAGRDAEYAAVVRSIAAAAAVLTVAAIGAELVVLPALAPVVGVLRADGLVASAAILTLALFFVAGLQSWIWPECIFRDRVWRGTLWSALAVLGGQYTIGPALVYLTGGASPVWFSIGFLSFYVLSLLPLWRELRRERPLIACRPQEAAAL